MTSFAVMNEFLSTNVLRLNSKVSVDLGKLLCSLCEAAQLCKNLVIFNVQSHAYKKDATLKFQSLPPSLKVLRTDSRIEVTVEARAPV